MGLYTLPAQPQPALEQHDVEIGLADVRKGIVRIVLGYLTALGTLLAVVGLLCYVAFQVRDAHSRKAVEEASTVLFAGMLVLGLLSLFSLALILRGKWLCLMSAPENYHAKWFMFASILCILTGPALNIGSAFIGLDKEQSARMSKAKKDPAVLVKQIEEYKKGLKSLTTHDYVKLAGDLAGVLSTVFFVLFLRAVALCCNDGPRARLAELYLLFSGLLLAGVVYFFVNPSFFLARPQLLIGLGVGWLFSALWYFLLIVSTIVCIGNILARPRARLSPY
jgi:hypothetical protein